MTEPVEMSQPQLLAPLGLTRDEHRAWPGARITEGHDVHLMARPPSSVVDGTVADGGRVPPNVSGAANSATQVRQSCSKCGPSTE